MGIKSLAGKMVLYLVYYKEKLSKNTEKEGEKFTERVVTNV